MKVRKYKAKKNPANKAKSSCTCIRCKKTKACRPDVFDKRVDEYGTLEELKAKYVCRDCRKKDGVNKFGITVKIGNVSADLIKKGVVDEHGKYFFQKPGYSFSAPAHMDEARIIANTAVACPFPNRLLDNGCCLSCELFSICLASCKKSCPDKPKVKKFKMVKKTKKSKKLKKVKKISVKNG